MCTESGCVRLIVYSLEECLEREFKQSLKRKASQQFRATCNSRGSRHRATRLSQEAEPPERRCVYRNTHRPYNQDHLPNRTPSARRPHPNFRTTATPLPARGHPPPSAPPCSHIAPTPTDPPSSQPISHPHPQCASLRPRTCARLLHCLALPPRLAQHRHPRRASPRAARAHSRRCASPAGRRTTVSSWI